MDASQHRRLRRQSRQANDRRRIGRRAQRLEESRLEHEDAIIGSGAHMPHDLPSQATYEALFGAAFNEALGCTPPSDAACLRGKTVADILGAQNAVFGPNAIAPDFGTKILPQAPGAFLRISGSRSSRRSAAIAEALRRTFLSLAKRPALAGLLSPLTPRRKDSDLCAASCGSARPEGRIPRAGD